MQNTTTFSIEDQINPETNEPFGSKYAGTFSIRRPSLQDKINTALRGAASLSAAGVIDIRLVSEGVLAASHLFSQIKEISTAPVPDWFDMDKIYDDGEPAVQAVYNRVEDFLDSFRDKKITGDRPVPGLAA